MNLQRAGQQLGNLRGAESAALNQALANQKSRAATGMTAAGLKNANENIARLLAAAGSN